MNRAALFGSTGVTLGAFGAHLLKTTLEARNSTASWKTAVNYQLLHAVAILALSTASTTTTTDNKDPPKNYSTTINLWTAGIVLFSGSIYGLSLGGPRILGPVTPLGGLLLIGGWLALLKQ